MVETQRRTRTQLKLWLVNRDVALVIMEACGSAHHWARWLANKLAPICYATLRNKEPFGQAERLNRKIKRQAFAVPA